ncbi:MAG: BRO family protein, partial [Lachnospiraceae bacterium]|nr:BRO family protein [Lachnospiraceae bacterium]
MAAAFKFAYNVSQKWLKMKNEIQVLKQTELLGRRLTVYGTMQEPLFLAREVAEWIEHSDVSTMIRVVDTDEKVSMTNPNNVCGGQNAWFLTEDGLYEILMQSRKPIAKQFKKGVKQILKEIRTTGGYIATQANETPEMIMARALKVAEHTIEEHEKRMKALAEENEAQKRINKQLEADTQMKAEEIKKLTPDADYARQTLSAVNTWNTNIIAKEMGMSAVTLNQHLQRLGI